LAPLVATSTGGYYLSAPQPQVIGHRYDSAMRPIGLVLGILLVLGGVAWIAQGLNVPFMPRSFMTSDRAWVLIGAATALGGIVLVGWARRRP
jgi:hypothetical protein